MTREDIEKHKSRILIVDDEAIVRKALLYMLGTSEFELTALPSAESACQWLEGNSVEVVLTDIYMNSMSGMELLEHIKAKYTAIEVIIITGRANTESANYAARAGAFAYLPKPFPDLETVIDTVRRAAKISMSAKEVKPTQQAAP